MKSALLPLEVQILKAIEYLSSRYRTGIDLEVIHLVVIRDFNCEMEELRERFYELHNRRYITIEPDLIHQSTVSVTLTEKGAMALRDLEESSTLF